MTNEFYSRIHYVRLTLTHKCNLNCDYCLDAMSRNNTGRFDQFDQFDQFIKKLPNLRAIQLFGGEALVDEKAKERFDHFIKTTNCLVGYFTNGILYDEKLEQQIKSERALIFSTIHTDKEAHDRHRVHLDGSGSYDLVIRNIKKMHKIMGKRMTICVVVDETEVEGLAEKVISLYKTCTDAIKLNVVKQGSGEMKMNFAAYLAELKKVIDYIVLEDKSKILANMAPYSAEMNTQWQKDYYRLIQRTLQFEHFNGVENILVDTDGMIYPSMPNEATITHPLGNINGEIYEENIRKFGVEKIGSRCEECQYKYMCSPCYSAISKEAADTSCCDYARVNLEAMEYMFALAKREGIVHA
jgi:radical SAM protein with 4Fe4S-binding SPASM domain